MLVSKTKQGEWFNLIHERNIEKLRFMRRTESFYCPECEEKLLLKVGTKRIPHFSHQKGALCSQNYERESDYHLMGKIKLFHWLEEQGLSPALEPYYREIAQRPDIGFVWKDVQYVIEFQCSTIPEELFKKRTKQYLQVNIVPIWIMAGKNIKRSGNNRVALSSFDYLFLVNPTKENWFLPAFCPETNSFIFMHHILPISVKNAFTHFSILNSNRAKIHDLVHPSNSKVHNLQDWILAIRKAKNITLPLYGNIHNKFLAELYAHQLTPSFLPPEIGLPVRHAPLIETPAVVWQSYLFIDLLHQKGQISYEQIKYAFMRRVRNRDIKVRSLPMYSEQNYLMVIEEYMELLIKLNIFMAVGPVHYKRILTASIKTNLVEHAAAENDLYKKFGNIIREGLK